MVVALLVLMVGAGMLEPLSPGIAWVLVPLVASVPEPVAGVDTFVACLRPVDWGGSFVEAYTVPVALAVDTGGILVAEVGIEAVVGMVADN